MAQVLDLRRGMGGLTCGLLGDLPPFFRVAGDHLIDGLEHRRGDPKVRQRGDGDHHSGHQQVDLAQNFNGFQDFVPGNVDPNGYGANWN